MQLTVTSGAAISFAALPPATAGVAIPLRITGVSGAAQAVQYLLDGRVLGNAMSDASYNWTPLREGVYRIVASVGGSAAQQDVVVSTAPAAFDMGDGKNAMIGTLPGAIAVTESGTSSYSIPIVVPPGVNGMQPI